MHYEMCTWNLLVNLMRFERGCNWNLTWKMRIFSAFCYLNSASPHLMRRAVYYLSRAMCTAMQFMKVTINNDTPKDNLMTGRGKPKGERGVRCVQVDNLNALVIWVHPKNNYCIITTFLPSIYTLWLLLRLLPWCIAGSSNIRTILCRVVAMRIIIL